jgi:hypothetical protein
MALPKYIDLAFLKRNGACADARHAFALTFGDTDARVVPTYEMCMAYARSYKARTSHFTVLLTYLRLSSRAEAVARRRINAAVQRASTLYPDEAPHDCDLRMREAAAYEFCRAWFRAHRRERAKKK